MDAIEHFVEPPDIEQDVIQPTDLGETTAETLSDLFPNYADNDDVVEETKKAVSSVFSRCRDRGELEDIWEKNDIMYRVKPDAAKDAEHRANESTGVFHNAINQLVSMAFKTFTDNAENYKFGFRGIINDEASNQIRGKNAEIMTLLFRKAQIKGEFKRNLKRTLLNIYKYGNAFVGIPWEKQVVDLVYRDKDSGERKSKPFTSHNLPALEAIPIDRVWLDENIEDMDAQPGVFIKCPVSWNTLLADSKKNKIKSLDPKSSDGIRNALEKFKETAASSEFLNAEAKRFDNADRTFQQRTAGRYKHWVIWINLPINKDTGKWDVNEPEIRCRVRIIGDPQSCEIVEIRENMFPGGIPLLDAHQTEDDIGMYHISLGEKVETYFDQICIGVDQLIDNRSKNLRRPNIYDPMRVAIDKYDFGHSNSIPCEGDVRSAFMELQIADMTGTIMATLEYCEMKIREMTNTTDAVVGTAMGGRTSANEYLGAKAAATTPIFSDMASIEDATIGEYMRRFAQYIHTFMTHEDIVEQIGVVGSEFTFDINDIYTVELNAVAEAMEKGQQLQGLSQLFEMAQDSQEKSKIRLRMAEVMGIENPAQFVSVPAKDQAIKAALWENNEMLVYSEWDQPETGEMHDVHLAIHRQALWQGQREKNQNVPMMQQHISVTEQLRRTEQAQGAGNSFPSIGQTASPAPAPTPGEEQGQAISAEMGNMQAGSPMPATQPAAPVG